MSELVNIHWNICQHYNAPHWYEQKPQPVAETDNAAILSYFAIHTDKKVMVINQILPLNVIKTTRLLS